MPIRPIIGPNNPVLRRKAHAALKPLAAPKLPALKLPAVKPGLKKP